MLTRSQLHVVHVMRVGAVLVVGRLERLGHKVELGGFRGCSILLVGRLLEILVVQGKTLLVGVLLHEFLVGLRSHVVLVEGEVRRRRHAWLLRAGQLHVGGREGLLLVVVVGRLGVVLVVVVEVVVVVHVGGGREW